MRFFCFHLMPWAHLPEDCSERYDSAWVTCPKTLYDPQFGHPLYNRMPTLCHVHSNAPVAAGALA